MGDSCSSNSISKERGVQRSFDLFPFSFVTNPERCSLVLFAAVSVYPFLVKHHGNSLKHARTAAFEEVKPLGGLARRSSRQLGDMVHFVEHGTVTEYDIICGNLIYAPLFLSGLSWSAFCLIPLLLSTYPRIPSMLRFGQISIHCPTTTASLRCFASEFIF